MYLAREKRTKFVVALKVLLIEAFAVLLLLGNVDPLQVLFKSQLQSGQVEHQLRREIEIQSHLRFGHEYFSLLLLLLHHHHLLTSYLPFPHRHEHILRLYGYFHDQMRVYLILEYAPRGELYKVLQKEGRFSEVQSATVSPSSLVASMQYLTASPPLLVHCSVGQSPQVLPLKEGHPS